MRPFQLSILICAIAVVGRTQAGPVSLNEATKDKVIQPIAPVCDPRWYFSIGGGIDVALDDSDLNQALAPHYFNNTLTTAYIKHHDWDDVYDDAWRIQAEAGYALTRHLEVFGLFKFAHADASDRTHGSEAIFDIVTVVNHFPITAAFDDYNSWGGELGLRYFFLPKESRIRPYIAVSGGATFVESIGTTVFVDFSSDGGPSDFAAYRGGFFDDSWVGTVAGTFGVEFALNCHWSIGVEGGVRYESGLSDDDRDFDSNGIHFPGSANITFDAAFARPSNNNAGERLYFPVTGFVKFRF